MRKLCTPRARRGRPTAARQLPDRPPRTRLSEMITRRPRILRLSVIRSLPAEAPVVMRPWMITRRRPTVTDEPLRRVATRLPPGSAPSASRGDFAGAGLAGVGGDGVTFGGAGGVADGGGAPGPWHARVPESAKP